MRTLFWVGLAIFALAAAPFAMLWQPGGELGVGLIADVLVPVALIGLALLAVGTAGFVTEWLGKRLRKRGANG